MFSEIFICWGIHVRTHTSAMVWNLTLHMTYLCKPMLSASAAEILCFIVELLQRHVKQIASVGDADATLKSQELLAHRCVECEQRMRSVFSRTLGTTSKTKLFHNMFLQAGGNSTPKVHLIYHLIRETSTKAILSTSR